MRKTTVMIATAAIVGLGLAVGAAAPADAAPKAAAKSSCFKKAAEGTNTDEPGAKFQAYEAILQSFDWGAWASWMSNKTTPGYKITTNRTVCKKGTGLGVTCVTQATICKI